MSDPRASTVSNNTVIISECFVIVTLTKSPSDVGGFTLTDPTPLTQYRAKWRLLCPSFFFHFERDACRCLTGFLHEWIDGSPVNVLFWEPGEPNNKANEHCAEMFSSNGLWNDRDCSHLLNFVCQVKKGEVKIRIWWGEGLDWWDGKRLIFRGPFEAKPITGQNEILHNL